MRLFCNSYCSPNLIVIFANFLGFMKYLITALLAVTSIQIAQSQTYEIGGLLGGANYIGDIGPTNYISPNDIAIGGLFRWNRTPRHSFRFSAMYARFNSDDADSKETRRQQRDLSFKNRALEASLGIEFTFGNSTPTQ